jgi:hypothetical protein
MSNDTTTTAKRPSFTAYSVRDYQKNGQKESDWNRIGVAWQHKDGDGFDIILDANPVNGRVAVRKNKPKQQG